MPGLPLVGLSPASTGACGPSTVASWLIGLGLLTAGLVARALWRETESSDDAFAYRHFGFQQRPLETTFQAGSQRANDRLREAGPQLESGQEAGSEVQSAQRVRPGNTLRRSIRTSLPLAGVWAGGLMAASATAEFLGLVPCSWWPATAGVSLGSGVLAGILGARNARLAAEARRSSSTQQTGPGSDGRIAMEPDGHLMGLRPGLDGTPAKGEFERYDDVEP
jgi:hypothetical protein